ncbi:hypothetical protein K7X08_016873 [Anisodus acutangulus]|uniref:Uncharacterized protein n=1 Tax=Anisodus acutangulus TaxID=402998 RepID=A0A9Q1LTM5_9SOLA|nr:hypothetical protein K7X08_016873 [Anisodus acutangulus]
MEQDVKQQEQEANQKKQEVPEVKQQMVGLLDSTMAALEHMGEEQWQTVTGKSGAKATGKNIEQQDTILTNAYIALMENPNGFQVSTSQLVGVYVDDRCSRKR